ncbi:hypothetical protein BCR35DRAFT_332520 [Leucosporidium creatinivorum]|uniref:MYND-type domain-containing protein n=1 Tax=Leucosporidium creatinivorum TaxID=106004 RepID=A0A1Y2F173_9BASI|nr:hypothetical protein BCR35DRAFT_332520 [Leucosporidium creatinivorum]
MEDRSSSLKIRFCFKCGVLEDDGKGSTRKLMACGRCRGAWYCSKECQAEDWKGQHKGMCKAITQHVDSWPTVFWSKPSDKVVRKKSELLGLFSPYVSSLERELSFFARFPFQIDSAQPLHKTHFLVLEFEPSENPTALPGGLRQCLRLVVHRLLTSTELEQQYPTQLAPSPKAVVESLSTSPHDHSHLGPRDHRCRIICLAKFNIALGDRNAGIVPIAEDWVSAINSVVFRPLGNEAKSLLQFGGRWFEMLQASLAGPEPTLGELSMRMIQASFGY